MPIKYDEDNIVVVSAAEAIRMRPEIYLGPLPNPHLLNRLVEEVLCLSIDEALCGRCTQITVSIDSSGVTNVRDNGPGLPMETDRFGRTFAEVLLTFVGACREAKRGETAKRKGCHIGLVVVNALSEWLRIRIFRDGGCWVQEYQKGVPQAPFRREGDDKETGLELSFLPDGVLLGKSKLAPLALEEWIRSFGLQFEYLVRDAGDALPGEPLGLFFKGIRPIAE